MVDRVPILYVYCIVFFLFITFCTLQWKKNQIIQLQIVHTFYGFFFFIILCYNFIRLYIIIKWKILGFNGSIYRWTNKHFLHLVKRHYFLRGETLSNYLLTCIVLYYYMDVFSSSFFFCFVKLTRVLRFLIHPY